MGIKDPAALGDRERVITAGPLETKRDVSEP